MRFTDVLLLILLVLAAIGLVIVCEVQPLREVVYVQENDFSTQSRTIEFVESGRRVRAESNGVVGDRFKVPSWIP